MTLDQKWITPDLISTQLLPILSTEFGIVIHVKFLQYINAKWPIFTEFGKDTSFKKSQLANTSISIKDYYNLLYKWIDIFI